MPRRPPSSPSSPRRTRPDKVLGQGLRAWARTSVPPLPADFAAGVRGELEARRASRAWAEEGVPPLPDDFAAGVRERLEGPPTRRRTNPGRGAPSACHTLGCGRRGAHPRVGPDGQVHDYCLDCAARYPAPKDPPGLRWGESRRPREHLGSSGVVRVSFLRFREGGEVLALFPDEPAAAGFVLTYRTRDQHAELRPDVLARQTVAASEGESAPLRAELESMGYRLEVVPPSPRRALPRRR